MKSLYKVFALLLMVAIGSNAVAQQLQVPLDFRVNSPANIAGSYDYGYQSDWGPVTMNTVTGDLAWGYDANGDSLLCNPAVTDLTGKVGLIRRGACTFSLKAYHAQSAGAIGSVICNHTPNSQGGGIVNMLGGDSLTAVTTPSIFLTFDDCEFIKAEVDAGNPVNVSFYVPSIGDAIGIWSYHTPVSQINDLDAMGITIYNNDTAAVYGVTASVAVTDPLGVTQTFTETIDTILGTSNAAVTFTSAYTPTVEGTYSMVYKGSLAPDSVVQDFVITPLTFALDDGNLVDSTGIWPADQTFIDANFRYDMGSAYIAGDNGGLASHASFAIANPGPFIGETFSVVVYDLTNWLGNETDYDASTIVAAGSYTITAADTLLPNSEMLVPLDDLFNPGNPLAMVANTQYLVTVQWDGSTSVNFLTIPPRYTYSGQYETPTIASTVFLDQLYTGGWASNSQPRIRLHLDGYFTNTNEVEQLEANEVSVFPNPATDYINVSLDLNNPSEMVDVKIINVEGKILHSEILNNVQQGTFNYSVSNYPAGHYILRVESEDGLSIQQFIVTK